METGKTTGYEIGSILKEMREEYWRGISETEEAQGETLECVTFSMGEEFYAFETSYASEVLRMPRLVKVPKVQECVTGVFNLRGEITAAIDIRPLLGLPQSELTGGSRIIVVRSDRFATGLIVEGVRGVEPLDMETFEPTVKSLSGRQREFIRGELKMDGRLVMLLDMEKLLAAPEIIVDNK